MKQPTDESMQKIHNAFISLGCSENHAVEIMNGLIIDMTDESGGMISDENAQQFAAVMLESIERAKKNKPELDRQRKYFAQCRNFVNSPFWQDKEGNTWELDTNEQLHGYSDKYKLCKHNSCECEYFPRLTEVAKWLAKHDFKYLEKAL